MINFRILDKKITGTLDQSNGCLIIYHEQKKDILYNGAGQVIENLLSTVEKLSEASLTLKKQHWEGSDFLCDKLSWFVFAFIKQIWLKWDK